MGRRNGNTPEPTRGQRRRNRIKLQELHTKTKQQRAKRRKKVGRGVEAVQNTGDEF